MLGVAGSPPRLPSSGYEPGRLSTLYRSPAAGDGTDSSSNRSERRHRLKAARGPRPAPGSSASRPSCVHVLIVSRTIERAPSAPTTSHGSSICSSNAFVSEYLTRTLPAFASPCMSSRWVAVTPSSTVMPGSAAALSATSDTKSLRAIQCGVTARLGSMILTDWALRSPSGVQIVTQNSSPSGTLFECTESVRSNASVKRSPRPSMR
mmetsp:Transcript_88677/g.253420  ORF Transcript_88677/g.253420 Transcript_88677/m.253420 type:complete len:207 (+) Transcript_88677:658-1278(+)